MKYEKSAMPSEEFQVQQAHVLGNKQINFYDNPLGTGSNIVMIQSTSSGLQEPSLVFSTGAKIYW